MYVHNNIMYMCESTTQIDAHTLQLEVAPGRLLCQPINLDPGLLMHSEIIEKSRNNNYLYRKVSLKKCFSVL